jgi:hypothetical protein
MNNEQLSARAMMQSQRSGEPHTTNQYSSYILSYSILFYDYVYISFLVSVNALVS